MTRTIVTLISIFVFTSAIAQEAIVIPKYLQNPMDSITKQSFNQSLEIFFSEMEQGKINEDLLELIKEENYLINTNNIKTALNNY